MHDGDPDALARAYGIPMRRTCRCISQWCRHHMAIRAMWKPLVEAGLVDCWRCGKRIPPDARWDMGHDDDDIAIWRGPETWACNRATSGRRKQRENRWVI